MIADDRGISSLQFLLASALGLVLFVGLANLVVVQYGKGALRSALEQGVRAGSLTGDTAACAKKVDEVIDQLLAGRMSDQVIVQCDATASTITATASAIFVSWTPFTPDFNVSLASTSRMEPPP